ncbi:MAG: PilZ domain-containing protein [Nitrospinota bacterium]
MPEKRQHPRIRLVLPSKVEGLECEVQEVSVSGLRFTSKRPLPAGTTQELTLHTGEPQEGEKGVRVRAAIQWCEPAASGEYEVGAEISEPDKEA